MTVARHILNRPAQFQWDPSSSPCYSSNCRPTTNAMIAGFYKDEIISPHDMRQAMLGAGTCGGTSVSQAVHGLVKYGISAASGKLSPNEIKLKLNQSIPVDITVDYGKIPRNKAYIQDMGFTGLHSVVACAVVINNGIRGILVRDPDRWGVGKVSNVFWPDSIWISAFSAASSLAAWPVKAKALPVIEYKATITERTPLFKVPNGPVAKYVTKATYRTTRQLLGGHWHYKINSGFYIKNTINKGFYLKAGTGEFTVKIIEEGG